jgi:methionine-gamma-lyase
VVVDNTYCSPYLQQPLLLGADVSVHSMTKYLGGHGDLTAGAAIFADAELAQRVRLYGLKDMTGAVMSPRRPPGDARPEDLALRMDRHCQSAQTVAEFIAAHPPPWCTSRPAQLSAARAGQAADAPDGRHDRL